MSNTIHECPMCGSPCTIKGDDKEGTHYYSPIKTIKMVRLEEAKVITESREVIMKLVSRIQTMFEHRFDKGTASAKMSAYNDLAFAKSEANEFLRKTAIG